MGKIAGKLGLASHGGKSFATLRRTGICGIRGHYRIPTSPSPPSMRASPLPRSSVGPRGRGPLGRRRPGDAGLLLIALLATGCGEVESGSEHTGGEGAETMVEEMAADSEPGPWHERSFVFVSADTDSVIALPWTFHTRQVGEREVRERDAWLGRAGAWDVLASELDTGRARGDAARILPGRALRIRVGPGDAVAALSFRTPEEEIEAVPGLLLAEWTGSPREVVRFHRARVDLGSNGSEGFLMDLSSRGELEADAASDWIFVHGGDFLQAAFRELPHTIEAEVGPRPYRGWTRIAVRNREWPGIQLEWAEVRSFEDARRDIPVRWSLSSQDGELTGDLHSVGSHLSAGEGEGPLLPVNALFQVEGQIRLLGDTVDVVGILRHRQP